MRQLIEHLTRGVVLKRRLPREFGGGPLFVSPSGGGLKYLKPSLEDIDHELLRAVREVLKPGQKVWDVGSNVGLFTYCAAYRVGPQGFLLALEPDVDNAALLHKTRQHLDPTRNAPVEILPAAVSRPGERFAKFAIAKRARAANSILGYGNPQQGGVAEVRNVPLVTLDELLAEFGAPDVVKIDVEGAETAVLQGAEVLLATARPIVVMEVMSENAAQVTAILRHHRYQLYDSSTPAESRQPLESAPWDTLALPDTI